MNPKIKFAIAGAIIASVIAVSLVSNSESLFSLNDTTTRADVVRIGYFPNINHAQAVIGLENGDKTTENGGNVEVIPVKNADILTLMLKKEIDGAWVPEPWGAKLVKEANSRIFLDERDLWPQGKFVTAHIIVSTEYLKNHPDVVKKLLAGHVDETQWINQNKEESFKVFNAELEKLTGKTIPEDELQEAFSRMEITYDPVKESLFKSASDAFDIGFLGDVRPDISGIYDLKLLNEVLEEKRLEQIP